MSRATNADVISSKLAKIETRLSNLKDLLKVIKEKKAENINAEIDETTSCLSETTAVDSEVPPSLSMDETADEGDHVYSQVASFISQNEQHPHFIIAMFSLLRFFDTDELREQALSAIKEVADDKGGGGVERIGEGGGSEWGPSIQEDFTEVCEETKEKYVELRF